MQQHMMFYNVSLLFFQYLIQYNIYYLYVVSTEQNTALLPELKR